MKKYKVWAHSGLVWLFDLGEFDDYAQAEDALYSEYLRQSDNIAANNQYKQQHRSCGIISKRADGKLTDY